MPPPPAVSYNYRPLELRFSLHPTTEEISRTPIFEERLTPLHSSFIRMNPGEIGRENTALAQALLAWSRRSSNDDFSALEDFLKSYPHSVWRASLLLNLGLLRRQTGYFLKALDLFNEAWTLARHETDYDSRAIADRALAEYADLNSRLGRMEVLRKLFAEVGNRDLIGLAGVKFSFAKEGLWLMQHRPQTSFLCGPFAVEALLKLQGKKPAFSLSSTHRGTSLAQLSSLARRSGMKVQLAKRAAGSAVLERSIIHWKAGHFAALISRLEGSGLYLMRDPTFGTDYLVSSKALDEEASGYALISADSLPEGWSTVSEREAAGVWGKGVTSGSDPEALTSEDDTECGCESGSCAMGMAQYDVHSMLVSLRVTDTPIGYAPPKGPAVFFTLTYMQRESFLPANPAHSFVGRKWTFNWLSYVTDDVAGGIDPTVTVYRRGGGQETFQLDSGTTYKTHFMSRAVLRRVNTNTYERRMPDGSREVYGQPNSPIYPRKVFLTQIIDPAGNALTLNYDEQMRLTTVTDALGQQTTLSYATSGNIFRVTSVTDPFGRTASFSYDAQNRLTRITDAIGITSDFTYGTNDFITSLTTSAYGTTRFEEGQSSTDATNRWLIITDAEGQKERVEFKQNAPGIASAESPVPVGMQIYNALLQSRNSFYWDKRAYAEATSGGGLDYTKAEIKHWLHKAGNGSVTSRVKESEKKPLESRVWYNYPGQSVGENGATFEGNSSRPSHIGRVLDNGQTQLYQYSYNDLGKVVEEIDPVGRRTQYVYSSDGIDLLEVRQVVATGSELLASYTYNSQHQSLTVRDASGQQTTNTYNSSGQLLTSTDPLGRVSSYIYNTAGYLTSVVDAGGGETVYTYDAVGRVRTVRDSDGYVMTYEYDNLNRNTRVSYPDGTYEEVSYVNPASGKMTLDVWSRRDRIGRVSRIEYDRIRRITSVTDAAKRRILLGWCSCGSLSTLTDGQGNVTRWEYDLQGRVIRKVMADNRSVNYEYEGRTSRVRRIVDAKGQATVYSYNKDNTVSEVKYGDSTTVNMSYDAFYNRVVGMVDTTGQTSYIYRPAGELGGGKIRRIDGPLVNDEIEYEYDALGRVVKRSLGTSVIDSVYDEEGRVVEQRNELGVFRYSYDGHTSRVSRIESPNGQVTEMKYYDGQKDHRLQKMTHLVGGVVVSNYSYNYNAVGEITSWPNAQSQVPDVLEYDGAGQLTRHQLLMANVYSYDAAGNRVRVEEGSEVRSYSYNSRNQLVREESSSSFREFSYDTNGNILSDGERMYEWDAANRLKAIVRGVRRSEFSYDGLGRRVKIVEKEGGAVISERRYVWCDAEVCEEREGDTVVKRYYEQGESERVTPEFSRKYYYTRDHLGSVREMLDESGVVVAKYDYSDWGEQRKLQGVKDTRMGFAGYFYHRESGLYLTWYRAYDPRTARWLSPDPIEEGDSINLYQYVYNDPVSYIDPSGMWGTIYGFNCGPNKSSSSSSVTSDSAGQQNQDSIKQSIDKLDECCFKHDDCYRKISTTRPGILIFALPGCRARNCDVEFLKCILKNGCYPLPGQKSGAVQEIKCVFVAFGALGVFGARNAPYIIVKGIGRGIKAIGKGIFRGIRKIF